MATTDQGSKSFFELLPAEIRDQIYDATMEQDIQRKRLNFQFRAPSPQLRLISRQFKDEYDRRSIWGSTLDVSFRVDGGSLPRHPKAPSLASWCTVIQLKCFLGKSLLAHVSEWRSFAITCDQLIRHLAPDSLQQLEVYLVWDSVRMLKDYASQGPNQLHAFLNYLIHGPTYHPRAERISSHVMATLKLHYGGIPPLNTRKRSSCDVLGVGLLKQPATLGIWSVKDGSFLLDEAKVSERLRMETMIEAATQATTAKDESYGSAEIAVFEGQIWNQE
jgi:hypothetical protein